MSKDFTSLSVPGPLRKLVEQLMTKQRRTVSGTIVIAVEDLYAKEFGSLPEDYLEEMK